MLRPTGQRGRRFSPSLPPVLGRASRAPLFTRSGTLTPLFTRSGTLRQVFLQGRRIARSAPHNSFEFNCHLQSGRPAHWGAGLWRSGWLGGQPQGRRTAMVCALRGGRLTRRRASRPLGERPQGSALTPGSSATQARSPEGSHSDPSWPAPCPSFQCHQARQSARRSEAGPQLDD